MELVNQSQFPAEVFNTLDVEGRMHLVLVAKATFKLIEGRAPELDEIQRPISTEDVCVSKPGLSAPLYEADLGPPKPRCDVILNATAYAPELRETQTMCVSVQIGHLVKRVRVVGDRRWRRGPNGPYASAPTPFVSMPLHYGHSFGGEAFDFNPVGVGHHPTPNSADIDDLSLPNLEALDDPIIAPHHLHRPTALSPLGRGWRPRRDHAGTYDQTWRDEVCPLLPRDFDQAFYQVAPADQQIPFPVGGEPIFLENLSPRRPALSFALPRPELAARVLHDDHRVTDLQPVIDTIYIEPDAGQLALILRASTPLDRRGAFGVKLVAAGRVCRRWWTSQVTGSSDCGCGGDSDNDADTDDDVDEGES